VTSSFSDPIYLLDQYEALRREALGPDLAGKRGQGLALFIARGMRAWIEVLSALVGKSQPLSPAQAQGPMSRPPGLPASLRSELTTVLADMILTYTQEIAR
jgi:hypothetical protein